MSLSLLQEKPTPTGQVQGNNGHLWQTALDQLQLQLTQATFDSWLRDSRLVSLNDGKLVIGVKSIFAKDWLENRLFSLIDRTVTSILGHPLDIIFVVDGTEHTFCPDDRQQYLHTVSRDAILAFDVYETGYINHAHYIQQFWGALLGAEAMQVWSYLRSFYTEPRYIYDRKEKAWLPNPSWTPWTPARTFRPSDLARAVASKAGKTPNRRKVTGGWVTCKKFQEAYDQGQIWNRCRQCGSEPRQTQLTQAKPSRKYPQGRPTCRYWQAGVFDTFKAEGLALIKATGDPTKPRTVFYQIQVYQLLPLLVPAQVQRLNQVTQQEHTRWLKKRGIDLATWESFEETSLLPLTVSWAGATLDLKQD